MSLHNCSRPSPLTVTVLYIQNKGTVSVVQTHEATQVSLKIALSFINVKKGHTSIITKISYCHNFVCSLAQN